MIAAVLVTGGTGTLGGDVNGTIGWRADVDGVPFGVVSLETADGVISGIRVVLNPQKLRHLQ